MTVRLLGPDGVQRRMEEIRSRLAEVFPQKFELQPENGAGLSGPIGSARPLSPQGFGLQISPDASGAVWQPLIKDAAQAAGIDEQLLDALVAAESKYDPNARSRAGAMGLTQLMPDTAKALGVRNPFDPMQNLQGGANYLSQMLARFGNNREIALAAYNAGPNAVAKHGGIPPYAETRAYVERVMALYNARKGAP